MFETLKAECDLEMQKKPFIFSFTGSSLYTVTCSGFISQVPPWADNQAITVFYSVKLSSLFVMFRPTLLLFMCRLP